MAKSKKEAEVQIVKISKGRMTINILGLTPLICNAMSLKSMGGLLIPPGKKTPAQKSTNIKHDVLAEYRNSAYQKGKDSLLSIPAKSFKASMSEVALSIPGSTKKQIGQMVWIEGDHVDVYGVPKLIMRVQRAADIKKTPDIRTNAILPYWATTVTITFVKPMLAPDAIFTLLNSAGDLMGVGENRPQKGTGDNGRFTIVDHEDVAWRAVVDAGGRKAQAEAFADPECYNEDTQELYDWYWSEVKRRDLNVQKPEGPADEEEIAA